MALSNNTKPPDIASTSVPETLAALKVNPDTGLTIAEVDIRRKAHGYNEVAEKKGHPVSEFLRKFWGMSAWMLEFIIILSAILRKYPDLVVVTSLLVVNAVVSFMQERRAAGVVEALRRRLQVSARVLREASWRIIPARDLVPGDIVRVRQGDIIPADVILLAGALPIDQSALTGESKDVDKSAGEMLSSCSVVRRGEGNGVVVLTGAKTGFGRTSELVQQARPKLHIDEVIAKVVRWLFLVVSALLVMVIIMSLQRGSPVLELVPLMLILLTSAIPLSLPVMFTVSMAVGSKELAKRGVLVTRLFQAMDAAGKDGAIQHVMSGVNPQGCQVFSFKHPSATELDHDFLWRTTGALPERGRIGIFNRSYYEEVLIVRVHPEILQTERMPDPSVKAKTIWKERYRSIVDLEKHLHRNGTRIIKFFLHLSKEEQRKRFLERIDDPDKNWKFSLADVEERKFWNDYMKAYEACLRATSTKVAPWHVVPADDKKNARLIISEIILDVFRGLKMSYPKSTAQRRRELLLIRQRLVR